MAVWLTKILSTTGTDPGEVKWVNFHLPFSDFFLIPQILKYLISLTLLQKFTPHFKILDPPLNHIALNYC